MQRLISRNDIARYRQISKTCHDEKLNEIILDAQIQDLMPLLGEKLFNQIMTSSSEYEDLLSGGPYDHDNVEYMNFGIKMLLSFFTYARYVMFSPYVDTPFSVVEKLNADSRPVDLTVKKTIYTSNRDSALMIWDNVKLFIIRKNLSDYHHQNKANTQGFRISKIM
ncbi:MAG: hypothetical protein EOO07_26360 [Chitinophagaceae bacterium]|nr:MAG: hypothetical protein EOO07_26360 [Chitinophagaceae bacterium]